MMQVAYKYAELGYSVIPVSWEKTPMIEFADRHLFMLEVKQFWRRRPLANIAIRCTHIFVVDVDCHEGAANGYDSIKPYVEADWWPKTLSQTTASGGKQYIFKKPKGARMKQIIGWLPGVDIKYHENNYFVAPPSSTKKGQYRWDNNYPIADCPDELKTLLEDFVSSAKDDFSMSHKIDFKTLDISFGENIMEKNTTAQLFETIINGFGGSGGRNDALCRFLGGLLARDVDPEIVVSLAEIANENTAEPLGDKEFKRTCRSIFATHERGGN